MIFEDAHWTDPTSLELLGRIVDRIPTLRVLLIVTFRQISKHLRDPDMPGKRVRFDDETWQALDLLARDQMKTFQELADEAFSDFLEKNKRPVDLKDALRKSAGHRASIHQLHPVKEKYAKR